MKIENETKTEKTAKFPFSKRHIIFFLVLFGLIGGGILRSSIATRLDSFTIDEGYHIGAGVAYIQTGDFRLNPEHPPLVKLWVGAFVSGIYQLSPYRVFKDKNLERRFVEDDVYLHNDSQAIQVRARIAMFALNGLLLILFAVAVRRVFGDIIALAATVFLVIDPTVAANLPVVMTDLPVALLSTTAVLLAVQAFRTWRALDLIFAAIALGLALSAKHSAVITVAAVAIIGLAMAFFLVPKDARFAARLRRVGLTAAVLAGAMIVLWSFYLFRYNESAQASEEQFNRPLAQKISDVNSSSYRGGLNFMTRARLFPRAYIWGMADTIRAGAEGRNFRVFAFGRNYAQAPLYLIPGIIAVKLPLGLLLLAVIGAFFWIARRIPREFIAPLLGVFVLSILFLIALTRGSSYGGIRHALPIVPFAALLASLAVYKAFETKSRILRGTVAVALIGALVSAIPVLRPWEYYNETVGGTSKGYLYFNDEGVDIGMRSKELIKFYNENLKETGEIPFIIYPIRRWEMEKNGVDWVRNDRERDQERLSAENLNGTFFITARQLRNRPDFMKATPVARFGNLFVFNGTFNDPKMRVNSLTRRAKQKIYTDNPDTEGAIKLLTEVIPLEPERFSNALELGNQYLKLGKREAAAAAYRTAKENAPAENEIIALLTRQIERLETEPLEQISPLRNPSVE